MQRAGAADGDAGLEPGGLAAGHCGLGLAEELTLGEQHPGAGVGDDVGQFLRGEVPVDRHVGDAGVVGGEHDLEVLAAVAGVQGDGVAGRQPQCAQGVYQAVAAGIQVAPGDRAPLVDQGVIVGPLLGDALHEVGHDGTFTVWTVTTCPMISAGCNRVNPPVWPDRGRPAPPPRPADTAR
jgi:hypothetical protein